MEDKGKMDELIEQMKLMSVLLRKQDTWEETKDRVSFQNIRGTENVL